MIMGFRSGYFYAVINDYTYICKALLQKISYI